MRLDKALDKLEDAGFDNIKLIDRRGNRHILIKRNWKVVAQKPRPGTMRDPSLKIRLGVVKRGETLPKRKA